MHLNNRTAIVTGASMGIGAATALALAKQGVTVWAVARNSERLEAVADQHRLIRPVVADVSDEGERRRLTETTGPVDILVNNAGLGLFGSVETMTAEDVRYMYELNVIGLIDLCSRYLPGMLERHSGHICNIGSSVSYLSGPPLTVYGSTKAAVQGFTDGLRREVLNRGVGVSLIQPGPVKTGFWARAGDGDSLEVPDESGPGVPAQWVARAIVKAIRFDRLPGYATVAVPRPLGMGRLLDLPLLSYGLDWLWATRGREAMEPAMVNQTGEGSDDAQSGKGGATEGAGQDSGKEADVIPLRPGEPAD